MMLKPGRGKMREATRQKAFYLSNQISVLELIYNSYIDAYFHEALTLSKPARTIDLKRGLYPSNPI